MYHLAMGKNEALAAWINVTTGSDSWRSVAEKLHTTHSTIQRRLGNHEADAIVELAEAYDVNPIPGLIAAGAISRFDVLAYAGDLTVESLSDVELARIMVKRLEEREEAERSSNISNPDVASDPYADGAVPTWDEIAHLPHAADSSPNEQTERENRGEDLID